MSERDYGEPWHSHRGEVCNRHNEVIVYCEGTPTEEEANRIVACVNACAGMADPIAEIAALRAENLHLRSDNAAMQGELNFCRAFADAINKHHANHEAVYRAIGDALGELENKRQGLRGSNLREDGTNV